MLVNLGGQASHRRRLNSVVDGTAAPRLAEQVWTSAWIDTLRAYIVNLVQATRTHA
jgi:hypothetical protein